MVDPDLLEQMLKDYILQGGRASDLHSMVSRLNRNLTNIHYLEQELKEAGEEYGRNAQAIQKLQRRNEELKRRIKALKFEIRNLKLLRKPTL